MSIREKKVSFKRGDSDVAPSLRGFTQVDTVEGDRGGEEGIKDISDLD